MKNAHPHLKNSFYFFLSWHISSLLENLQTKQIKIFFENLKIKTSEMQSEIFLSFGANPDLKSFQSCVHVALVLFFGDDVLKLANFAKSLKSACELKKTSPV